MHLGRLMSWMVEIYFLCWGRHCHSVSSINVGNLGNSCIIIKAWHILLWMCRWAIVYLAQMNPLIVPILNETEWHCLFEKLMKSVQSPTLLSMPMPGESKSHKHVWGINYPESFCVRIFIWNYHLMVITWKKLINRTPLPWCNPSNLISYLFVNDIICIFVLWRK